MNNQLGVENLRGKTFSASANYKPIGVPVQLAAVSWLIVNLMPTNLREGVTV